MPLRALVLGALLIGCGGGTSSPSATATSSGGERARPVGTPIAAREADAPAPTATRTLTRAEFEAQWSTPAPTPTGPTIDMGGLGISGGGGPYAAYGGMGYDSEHPIGACGTDDSYQIVASYVCPDGSMPLAGSASAGAGARLGNVGANSTGHIIDLYEVPCPNGAVQLYVDMYACGGMPF